MRLNGLKEGAGGQVGRRSLMRVARCTAVVVAAVGALLGRAPALADLDPLLPDQMLIDFDTGYNPGQLVVDEGSAAVVSTNGNDVLELTAAAGQRVKVRLAPASGTWNLIDYVNLTMDLENLGGNKAWLRILIKDTYTTTESWYRPNCSHNAWVEPGETRVFNALMPRHRYRWPYNVVPSYINLFPSMTGLPHGQMLTWYGVDVTQLTEVILQLEPQDYAQTLRIDNLRGSRRAKPIILETDPDAFFPFIDEYGQYMHEDWPGKITSDADLSAALVAEQADMTAHPRTLEQNEYGGWANGPTLAATGHFRTEKVDGRWWFVDPSGKLFWSLGCTDIGLTDLLVNLDGKEHFYTNLPSRTHPVFGAWYVTTAPGAPAGDFFKSFYPVLYKKYGASFESMYNGWSLERIRNWGLNTRGAWSGATDNQPAGLETPYTRIFWTPGKGVAPIRGLDDPFDAGFSNAVVTAIGWTGSANDPYCIGFFDNNEIKWGSDPEQVARDIMEDCDATVATKVALVDFLEAEYGTISAANAAWGSSYTTFNDLLPALGNNNFSWVGAAASMESFYAHLTDTYYRKVREALKSVAPNKLYLGSRIYEGTMVKEVASAAAAHCDVVSFNIYHKDVDEFQGVTARNEPFFPEDKPFIIGEFNFGALDRGKFWTGIEYAADQRNRREAYIHYIESALDNPRCVGAHWFSYVDGPTASRYKDSENAGKGLIDSSDTPHAEMVTAVRAVGSTMYAYRHADNTSTNEVFPLLANWQFNEAAGPMSTASNSAGLAAWTDDANWTLNGSGQAEVSGLVGEQNAAPFSAVTSGSVFMRVDYAAWSFDGDSQVRTGFQLDNQDLYVRLRGRPVNPFFGVGNNFDQGISADSTNGASVILGLDLDADTYSLWWDNDRTGSYTPIYQGAAMGLASSAFINPYVRNTQFTASNPIGIHMLVYGTNLNDVVSASDSAYDVWSFAHGLTGGQQDDDDNDGRKNLLEFATGGNPTNVYSMGYSPTIENTPSSVLYVYPRRIGSGLTYWLETRTNLLSGDWTNGGYSELPMAGSYDPKFEAVTNQVLKTGDQLYIRLGVQEN